MSDLHHWGADHYEESEKQMANRRPRITATYTYVTMDLSAVAYNEIRQKLEDAGYQHAISDDGVLDMNGLALVLGESEDDPEGE